MKTPFFFLPIGVLSFILLFSCSSNKEQTNEENVSTVLPDKLSEVSAMRMEYTDFMHELIADGTISSQNKADLRFPTQEVIAAIYLKNGDRVEKGQKIAELDRFKLQNSLTQAKDNLERARLELQNILIGQVQGYSVGDTANIPPEIMQLARTRSNFDQSEAQYLLAEYNYNNAVLYAPFSGVIANLFSKTHNLPSTSEPFCSVIDNSRMEADFTVLESELLLIKIGDKVQITPYSVNNFVNEGRVSEINPIVDKNGMVRVKAALSDSQARLFDGMNIRVRLQRPIGKQLVIPKEALVLRSNKKVVFKLQNGHAVWVYVDTGFENSTDYVVTSGLAEGDSIIYEGNINLAHEAPVIIKN